MKLFRRKLSLPLSFILCVALLLAACGKENANPAESKGGATATASASSAAPGEVPASPAASNAASPESTPAAEEAATRIYVDDTGKEIEIPARPERVVASYYLGHLLSLGVTPIGTAGQFFLDSSYLHDRLAGVDNVGDNGSYNMEKILSLQPDLIIVNEFVKPEEAEKLAEIAPTVTIKYAGSDMFAHLGKVADVLGKKAEAEQWAQQYRAKAAELKEQLGTDGDQAETATVIQVMAGQLYVYFENIAITVYRTLGFAVPPHAKEVNAGNESGFAKVSLEVLPDYTADRVFVVQPYDAASEGIFKEMQDSAVWKGLPAVRDDHVYFLDNRWNGTDPVSMDAQLEDIKRLLVN